MSSGWSWFVIALMAVNTAAVLWLLWSTAKRRPGDPGPEDTSHYWDEDITEYNKPMPRWWIVGFYATIVFALGYVAWFGGMGSYDGLGEWSSRGEHAADAADAASRLASTFEPYADKPLAELSRDADAMRLGRSVFANTCSTCHGSSARGARGYPDLTDSIWHWGGSEEAILATVMHGRQAAMPPLGAAMGGELGITQVATYVQSLSGQQVDPALRAAGKTRFDGICAACHGADGRGNLELGAPDLTDRYWLYGGSMQAITESIRNGRNGMMPAHAPLLGETRARLAAAYVWSLSQPAAQQGSGSP